MSPMRISSVIAVAGVSVSPVPLGQEPEAGGLRRVVPAEHIRMLVLGR
ncbi:hypothetical protein ACFYPZ_41125 [Streptomyces sp. NPDC005506]